YRPRVRQGDSAMLVGGHCKHLWFRLVPAAWGGPGWPSFPLLLECRLARVSRPLNLLLGPLVAVPPATLRSGIVNIAYLRMRVKQ
ncbi:MAG: hypothetical protein L0287_29055, partial [Anaerolineae bacterium]|nr:hypothetical protein [Anaerolineae bacterium]